MTTIIAVQKRLSAMRCQNATCQERIGMIVDEGFMISVRSGKGVRNTIITSRATIRTQCERGHWNQVSLEGGDEKSGAVPAANGGVIAGMLRSGSG